MKIRRFAICNLLFAIYGLLFTTDAFSDTLKTQQDTLKKLSRSPNKAMLLSAAFPGGGQFYTQNYIKGILIGGTQTVLGYLTLNEHLRARKSLKENDTSNYIYHRDRRNDFLFLTGAVLAFSIADAYVSAHMFRFREEAKLSFVSSSHCPLCALRFGITFNF